MSTRRATGFGALALAGCSLVIGARELGPSNRCGEGAPCDVGRCDAALGACVDDPDAPYEFVLALVLPRLAGEGRAALTTVVGPYVATAGDASADVLVRHPVSVVGRVRAGAVEGGAPVDAELVFTPARAAVGPSVEPIRVGTATARPEADPRERDLDYATQLIPGVDYDVEVRPRGADAARHYPIRGTLALREGQRYDVALPEESVAIEGLVLDERGAGQGGLEVRAIDVATGALVSSVAATALEGAEPGAFALHVDPSAASWVLEITAPPSYPDATAFPTVVIDPSVLAAASDGRVRLLVPRPETGACFAGVIEFPATLGGGRASGAAVTLRASALVDPETGLRGAYTVTRVAGAEGGAGPVGACSGTPLGPGEFEARLLPGEYEIEVRPLEPALGVLLERSAVRGDVRRVFTLPARSVLGALVQRASDAPIADAIVRAWPLHTALPGTQELGAARLNRPSDGLTDPTGQVSLPLDVGVYDLVVEPPQGSAFAWVVRPGFGIGGSDAGLREVFDVRTPVAVRGLVHAEDGVPLDAVEVAAYGLVDDGDGTRRPVPIGRATSGPDGSFTLLLPPSLGRR